MALYHNRDYMRKVRDYVQPPQPQPQPALTPREEKRLRRRQEKAESIIAGGRGRIVRSALLWAFQIVIVIMFAYVTVYFFGQSRTNVGQGMDPTLSGGDTVLINTLAYQLGAPERGDIVSFRPNGSGSSHSYIMRVIGLPGEKVQIIDGMIYIDGKVFLEQKDYPSITNPGMAADEIRLSDQEYFLLGDNRNNSEDSRFAEIGNIKTDEIEGKVWFVTGPAAHRRLLRG